MTHPWTTLAYPSGILFPRWRRKNPPNSLSTYASHPPNSFVIGILTLAWVTAVGCGTAPKPIDPKLAYELTHTPYPQDAQIKDLDIVVVRDGPTLVLTNRTAMPYHDAYLWLNQQYVAWVEHLPIGTDVRVELVHAFNQHGEPYPVGGPLTPDQTFPIVLAELHHGVPHEQAGTELPENSRPQKRYRLLVRPSQE